MDDSLHDFKSPKKVQSLLHVTERKTTLIKKPSNKKTKPIINKNHTTKSTRGNQRCNELTQPAIKSSFFKPKTENISEDSNKKIKAYVCPLCFKTIKDESSHTIHIKSCAASLKITTAQVLNAIELQEKQIAEREALGLPAVPPLQEKKKKTKLKDLDSNEDFNYKLGLALSKSLYETEESDEFQQLQLLGVEENSILLDTNEGGVTLQNFGFKTSKNIKPQAPTLRGRKKKLLEPTKLQTTSNEERNRLLTEKISEVLIDNDDFTQNCGTIKNELMVQNLVLKSHLLKSYQQKEKRLWNNAKLESCYEDFYVSDLAAFIIPVKDELGDINFDDNNKDYHLKDRLKMELSTDFESEEENLNIDTANSSNTQFVNSLTRDWKNILNKSSISDIIIFVKDGKHIWAHKLIFFVRCQNILLDTKENKNPNFSTVKEQLCWINFTYDSVLYFLEFLYCGIIEDYNIIVNNTNLLSEIRLLARKYKVKELFEYLKRDKTIHTDLKDDCANKEFLNIKANNNLKSPEINLCNSEQKVLKNEERKALVKESSNNLNSNSDIKNWENNCPNIPDKVEASPNTSVCNKITGTLENEVSEVFVETSSGNTIVEFDIKNDKNNLSVRVKDDQNDALSEHISISPDLFDDSMSILEENKNRISACMSEDNSKLIELANLIEEEAKNNENPSRFSFKFEKSTAIKETRLSSHSIETTTSSKDTENILESIKITSPLKTKIVNNDEKYLNTSEYIQLIQRCNADSDDEEAYERLYRCYKPNSSTKKKRRNPFKKRSELFDMSSGSSSQDNKSEKFVKKRSALSMLGVRPSTNGYPLNNVTYTRGSRSVSPFTGAELINVDSDNSEDEESQSTRLTSKRRRIIGEPETYHSNSEEPQSAGCLKYHEVIVSCSSSNSDSDLSEASTLNLPENISEAEEGQVVDKINSTNFLRELNEISMNPENRASQEVNNSNNVSTPNISCDDKQLDLGPIFIPSSPELLLEDYDFDKIIETEVFLENVSKHKKGKMKTLDKSISLGDLKTSEKRRSTLLHRDAFNCTQDISKCSRKIVDRSTKSYSTRHLGRKSKSEGNFFTNKINNKETEETDSDNDSSFDEQKSLNDIAYSKYMIHQNDTITVDYNLMSTPDLQKEMKKYGLKAHTRPRAVKLLTYIFEELYPFANYAFNTETEEKLYLLNTKSTQKANCRSATKKSLTKTNEKKSLNKRKMRTASNDNEADSSITDRMIVKEKFFQFLRENEDLHNNILRFNPINLSWLFNALKAEGLKCKRHDLIKFLDDQCITFVDTKKNKTKRHK
ncbi:putative leucine-rich repeat-containing protein DDB_G0290503 [Prorops nasuta]|uniref:putative leucine-rich repeat-containing protein DDB_G0290503 n=1 Tax=Prorops nasuta TaxID=863751 RepID=UPI0034CD3A7E